MTDYKDILHDIPEQGLSWQDRKKIREVAQRTAMSIAQQTDKPQIAFVALLNCLGSLIAQEFPQSEYAERIALVNSHIPMYVHAYSTKEKSL